MINGAVCPCERIKRGPRPRRWRASQGDVAEESFALARALVAESLGCVIDGQAETWIHRRIRIRRRIEPGRERVGASLEARRRLQSNSA